MSATRIRIFYPADPMGVVPGGIDTFLRGLIKWAPTDLEFSLVGMTTDPEARPPGRWTSCRLGNRDFNFFPVVTVSDAGGRGMIPLSVRFSRGTWLHREALTSDFDIFDFHRPEPSLLFMADRRPKNAFFHNDPSTIESIHSDNQWKRLPGIYKAMERRAFENFSSAWCVHASGVQTLRGRYPLQASRIHFIPTWVDAEVFSCVDDQTRQELRDHLAKTHQIDQQAQWVVTVGRLDTQKDPMLMLAAVSRLRAQGRRLAWLIVGDGVLRADLQQASASAGLGNDMHFLGLRPATEIAALLRAADVYALSSAYEGMPMALLEALGCGLPAVVTDVGEVRRVVLPGKNGAIAASRDEATFAQALAEVLDNAAQWRGPSTQAAVAAYQPGKVLTQAYENYRVLGQGYAQFRLEAQAAHTAGRSTRRLGSVVGVSVDMLDRADVGARLTSWARNRQSRTVCFCNVHSAVTARFDERHRLSLFGADLVAADGAPIAWALRQRGNPNQERVDGPGMMWHLCGEAQAQGIKIGLYGSSQQTLNKLTAQLHVAFPQIEIAYAYSPPFRELTEVEDRAVCDDISHAGVGLLFVGLGCPKQEFWMATHRGRIPAVMLGVGAAFEFHAGTAARAPQWMSEHGLEWFHRLWTQPRRLWRRYLFSNSAFLLMRAREVWRRPRHVAQVAVADVPENGNVFDSDFNIAMNTNLNQRSIEDLVTRVNAQLSGTGGRIIGFIASGTGEGTSTLAQAYTNTVTTRLRHRVLLLSAINPEIKAAGVLTALSAGLPLEDCLKPLAGGGVTGSLGGQNDADQLWGLLEQESLWQDLRSRFDDIVLDLPASSVSRLGLLTAPHCDGVIVVIEADKTRAPVVENLIDSLQALRATVIGTVLNRRRFYLPKRVYRWL